MRLPPMTTQRWMVFFVVFAITLTFWVGSQRWLATKIGGLLAKVTLSATDNDTADQVDLRFWSNIDTFLHKFWFVFAVLAAEFSFCVAAWLPLGKAKPDLAAPPVLRR